MRNDQVMEVRMVLVARMTQELVMSVGADSRDACTKLDYWTVCDVGLAHGGKVGLNGGWRTCSADPCSNVANSRAVGVGMSVSGYLDFYLRRPSPENS